MVLWVSLFLYMRQRITLLEEKVALLSKLTTTVAGITKSLSEPDKEPDEPYKEPNESDKESDESDESEDESHIPVHLTMNEFPRFNDMNVFKCVMLDNSGLLNMSQEMNAVEIEELDETDKHEVEYITEPVKLSMKEEPVELSVHDFPEQIDLSVPDLSNESDPIESSREVNHPVDADLPKRVVSVDDVKTLSVTMNYEALSVKELKDKVAELNGPKLKTKKELLEFLKNKM